MARPTQQEIDEFNARMAEPEGPDEDDFDIEIFTPEGHGARLPYRKGRTYLAQHFGIDVGDIPPGAGASGGQQPPQQQGKRNSGQQQQQRGGANTTQVPPNLDESGNDASIQGGTASRYFGRNR